MRQSVSIQCFAKANQTSFTDVIATLKTLFSYFSPEACVSRPCQNDGECVDDDDGGYECKCTPNWEGKNCELPKCKLYKNCELPKCKLYKNCELSTLLNIISIQHNQKVTRWTTQACNKIVTS